MRIKIATLRAVAIAIYKAYDPYNDQPHCPDFSRLSPNDRDSYLCMAKAAIEEYVKCQMK